MTPVHSVGTRIAISASGGRFGLSRTDIARFQVTPPTAVVNLPVEGARPAGLWARPAGRLAFLDFRPRDFGMATMVCLCQSSYLGGLSGLPCALLLNVCGPASNSGKPGSRPESRAPADWYGLFPNPAVAEGVLDRFVIPPTTWP